MQAQELPLWVVAAKEGRWLAFHRANPWVYRSLVFMARKARQAGRKRIGIRMLWEVMRWDSIVRPNTGMDGGFQFNDHYPPFYARLIMAQEPDLAGIFEIRGQPWH